MIHVREAEERDLDGVREVFLKEYGGHYAYPEYCEIPSLKKMVFDDETLLLVAEDDESGMIVGTASVIFDMGAFGDLLGEFGRLAVHPEGRGKGIGKKLMARRILEVQDRLHVAIVDNRVVHTYSQKISARAGFTCAGLLPKKLLFGTRESLAMYVRHFGGALSLRKNNPRIIPEAYPLAEAVLKNLGLPCDVIADEETASYPGYSGTLEFESMKTEGYSSLLRFERGRVVNREIFGPVRLHMGWFKIRKKHSQYLIAREEGRIVGAIGYMVEEHEHTAAIFELITVDAAPTRMLLESFEKKCREDWGIQYIEVDVNAHAPAMQRTLLELGFLPAAYLPAMVFDKVERLDGIRMVKLNAPIDMAGIELDESALPAASLVLNQFIKHEAVPALEKAARDQLIFAGLNDEQIRHIASSCNLKEYEESDVIFEAGSNPKGLYILLEGEVNIFLPAQDAPIAVVGPGEFLGEVSMLNRTPRAATAIVRKRAKAVFLNLEKFKVLIRQRPGIGLILYRNLARGLGRKLNTSNLRRNDHQV